MTSEEPLLRVRDLHKHFPIYGGILGRQVATLKAANGVSFDLRAGETLGLVGETGCGKSTTGRTILQLYPPDSGEVIYRGTDLAKLSPARMREHRREIQMIFQDPYASLNPRMTVQRIIEEPMIIHGIGDAVERRNRVTTLLDEVGLDPTAARRFPHEFSGGQRQRIGIARCLATNAKLIIADEPVSALDVSIQAQVVNLLMALKRSRGLTIIFIAHDLAVVKHISDRVAVMYLGKIVEIASSTDLYANPLHPYTKALLSAVPIPEPGLKRSRILLEGDVTSPLEAPPGCPFAKRCPVGEDDCMTTAQTLQEIGSDHHVACRYVDKAKEKMPWMRSEGADRSPKENWS